MQAILIRKLVRLGEHLLNRIPVVKTIYSATKDPMSFVELREDDSQQVVMVNKSAASPARHGPGHP